MNLDYDWISPVNICQTTVNKAWIILCETTQDMLITMLAPFHILLLVSALLLTFFFFLSGSNQNKQESNGSPGYLWFWNLWGEWFVSLSLALSECVRLDGPASSPPVDLYQMRAKAGFQTKHTHTINTIFGCWWKVYCISGLTHLQCTFSHLIPMHNFIFKHYFPKVIYIADFIIVVILNPTCVMQRTTSQAY